MDLWPLVKCSLLGRVLGQPRGQRLRGLPEQRALHLLRDVNPLAQGEEEAQHLLHGRCRLHRGW